MSEIIKTTSSTLFSSLNGQLLKEDAVAAFSIALVTVPLSIGIAVASGVPPMAGIFSAIIGGLLTTFLRSSQLTLNGPAASLIVVCLATTQLLGGGDALLGFRYFLAASVCAGVLLMLMGLFKMGKYGDIFPSAVIYGILAAIGLIILSRQIPVALDVDLSFGSSFEGLMLIPDMILAQNPFVGIISIVSLGILIGFGYLKNPLYKIIPAPVWVVVLSFLITFGFNFHEAQELNILGESFEIGPSLLVEIPTDIQANLFFPDFSLIGTFAFWRIVVVIALIVSIETMISAKAMDRIDPLRRQTNFNRDLFACGASTIVSSMIGGLPIITAVPLYYGAKTKYANFFMGILLLLFVLFFSFIINGLPLAALAALLIFTGYKLASPKIFRDIYRLGFEQFVIFFATLIIILFKGVLLGALFGFIVTLAIHYSKSNLHRKYFIKYLFNPFIKVKSRTAEETYIITKGILNFANLLQLKNVIRSVKGSKHVILDMSNTRLVDCTIMEYLHEEVEKYELPNTRFEIIGLDAHEASSRHPNAMHVLPENRKPQLTRRQQALEKMATDYDGKFWPEVRWDISLFKEFTFFQKHAIEYKLNMAKGNYYLFFEWESSDITFGQGALIAAQERHTSVILLHLPFHSPVFILDKEGFLERIGARLAFFRDVNFEAYPNFSRKYILKGPNEKEIRSFFGERLLSFLEDNEQYHIECNGTMVLIFKEMRFASPSAMAKMHEFAQTLSSILLAHWKSQTNKIKV